MALRNVFLIVVATVMAGPASSEEARFPVERFRPAIDGSGVLDVDSGDVGEPFSVSVGGFANYALNPLVLRNDTERVGALVAHRVGLDVVGSLSLFHWVQLGVDMPVLLFQARDTAAIGNLVQGAGDLQAVGLGDLRLLAKVRILRARDQGIDLAIIPAITVPSASLTSADAGNYVGEGQLTFAPEVAISRSFVDGPLGGVRLAGNVGVRLRPEERKVVNVTIGHELTYRAGVSYRLGGAGSELSKASVSASASGGTYALQPFSSGFEENPLEVLLGADYDPLPFVRVTGGVGKGILSGFGTPDFRAFVGARFMSLPSTDRDGDGIDNEDDQCPDDAEDKDGFNDNDGCPDPDNDGDGIADNEDGANGACKDAAEDKDGVADEDGCPEDDADGDGVLDGQDKCPREPGPPEDPTQNQGCPWPDRDGDGVKDGEDKCVDVPGLAALGGCPDRDGDGVIDSEDLCHTVPGLVALKGCPDKDGDGVGDRDDECPDQKGLKAQKGCPDKDNDGFVDPKDKCPDEPETVNNVQDDDGCPDSGKTSVQLTREMIEILDKIYFDSGKDTIQRRSFGLLDQIATIMKQHPELTRVRIEGHTDSDGSDDSNLDLSARRAASVKRALVERGVGDQRLDAKGFGEARPITPNANKKAKEKNRRVEFVIVEFDGEPVEDTRSLAPGAERKTP